MNSFSIVILTIGIPGSGKSTWVKHYLQSHPLTRLVSTDAIRKELTGEYQCNPDQNEMIHDEARRRVKQYLDDWGKSSNDIGLGPEIIVDSTNVDLDEWIKYKQLGSTIILAKVFDITPEESMNRQKNRSRIVPKSVVEDKWVRFQSNKKYMPFIFNMIF